MIRPGQRCTVMGLGRFGGGAGVAQWLARRGARVRLTDLQPAAKLAAPLQSLRPLIEAGSITHHLGGHRETDFAACDLVVANPAVPRPWENRFLRAAASAGVPITTEIRLVAERLDRRQVIGITGTAGKSTTAAMTHHILQRSPGVRPHFGGNIGGSLLESLETIRPDDWVVLELSSAMLYWLGEGVGAPEHPGWSPRVAVMTNLAGNHLDWHGSFEHYRQSKLNIFAYQQPGDPAIDSAPNEPTIELPVPGRHNQLNARMAIAAAGAAAGVSPASAADALADFLGLPHRLEIIARHDELRFFNDSTSTTPEATCLVVEAFEQPATVHLIAGGYDKGVDLSRVAALADRLAGFYTIGTTGQPLASAAARGGHAEFCEHLEAAAERALARMKPGDTLLLSPGCASWDQYDNYEQRGEAFCECVRQEGTKGLRD